MKVPIKNNEKTNKNFNLFLFLSKLRKKKTRKKTIKITSYNVSCKTKKQKNQKPN